MIKINVLAGFLTGIVSTATGMILYILLFSDLGLQPTLKDALRNDYLGKIIVLGAALNFLPFFVFLKKDLVYHARGVLLSMVVIAVALAVYKFW
ncbi:hypothetical protein LZ575_12495 [Antarcticibacterium sp. 1MA-6-2]|uniref:hypothetical protein n=1 Tax=Antarcticibacterium sp. 1MA-6-2 TaxID=2908210 RepID=UPI001F3A5A6F|nr:hypothetical protein [Antarcticibacterium sp. 1MA-6-2]UJH89828.1 hypothetical protein LZ575_12495 [Antarcticibacterium sp. 1MA-6-2]